MHLIYTACHRAGLSSAASIFQNTVLGIDSDEVEFLLSAIADKVKLMKDAPLPLRTIAMGMCLINRQPHSMLILSLL